MGRFSLAGIILTVVTFFALFGFFMAQIEVENPYTNTTTTILEIILDWLNPFDWF